MYVYHWWLLVDVNVGTYITEDSWYMAQLVAGYTASESNSMSVGREFTVHFDSQIW